MSEKRENLKIVMESVEDELFFVVCAVTVAVYRLEN
jgi:hypothetical protein